MTNKFFPPEFRTASVVPRWSIVWTLTRDVLSNHSFFVTLYANQIARMIEWGTDAHRYVLMCRAVGHDLDETISGDLVAPAKKAMLDTERAQAYLLGQMQERMPTIIDQMEEHQADDQIWKEAGKIVKAADRLDALLFLTVEKRMGNGVIAPLIPQVYDGLRASWHDLPADPKKLAALWVDVKDAVTEHATSGGFGV